MSEHTDIFVSIIIPVYKESADTIGHLYNWIEKENDAEVEWILVGVSDDHNTWNRHRFPSFARLITASKGRSSQMNAGALKSKGRLLLFLHADTKLSSGWLKEMRTCHEQCLWGFFQPQIDGSGLLLRLAEWWGCLRSRILTLPYGDQAIFVDALVFKQLGGFDEVVQFMEDVDLVSRLKAQQLKPIILRNKAITSARNWQGGASLLYSCKNFIAILMYLIGVPRRLIKRFYSWFRNGLSR